MSTAGPPEPTPDGDAVQVWEQVVGGRTHRVEATGTVRHRVRWVVDGVEVATAASTQEKVRVEVAAGGEDDPGPHDDLGHLQVVFTALGKPRRATLHPHGSPEAQALLGIGGTDLLPAPGSPAAAYEQRVRDHPTRHALVAGGLGVVRVLGPILAGALLLLLARWVLPLLPDLPRIPWPDLPDIPWPDIPWPDIRWPDLPSIPWPDLPEVDIAFPGWLRWVLDSSQYVVPVVIALVLARGEVRRRRAQDAQREQARHEAARPDDRPDDDRPADVS